MPSRRFTLISCTLILASVQLAQADLKLFEPLEQTRWVRAEARMFDQQEVDLRQAGDLDRFSDGARASFLVDGGPQFISLDAQAYQDSELVLSPDQVLVNYRSSMGVALISLPDVEEPGALFGRGESFFELIFRLHLPHYYFLPAGPDVAGIMGDARSLDSRLMTADGRVIVEGFDDHRFEEATGLLPIGTYILRQHGAIERSSPDRSDFAGDLNFRLELVPIPLPAAVWPGLMMLAGLGVTLAAKRGRHCTWQVIEERTSFAGAALQWMRSLLWRM
jgi:hypothetical protein